MERITCTPNYDVLDCSDLCGFLPRYTVMSSLEECRSHAECKDCIILKAFQHLKEYEDTGLTPEQIHYLTIRTTMPKEWIHRNGDNN